MNYTLSMPGVQGDFNRYVSLSSAIDSTKLDLTAVYAKQKLIQFLQYISGFDSSISINLIKNERFTYDVVFDFPNQDVYLKLNNRSDGTTLFTVNTMVGKQNSSTTELPNVNSTQFTEQVIKPMKLVLVMNFEKIANFINECWTEVVNADNFINKVYDSMQNNIANNVDTSAPAENEQSTEVPAEAPAENTETENA